VLGAVDEVQLAVCTAFAAQATQLPLISASGLMSQCSMPCSRRLVY
jgi:hypothetical protein